MNFYSCFDAAPPVPPLLLLLFIFILHSIFFQLGPAPSDTPIQSPCTSSAASLQFLNRPPWLDELSCPSLNSAETPPPLASSLNGHLALTPPPNFLLPSGPEWNSFYSNLMTPPSPSSGDRTPPDSLSWGRRCAPGECLPVRLCWTACVL